MPSLAGKVVIVTGATRGIGSAIARHLHGEGAAVLAAPRASGRVHLTAPVPFDRVIGRVPTVYDPPDRSATTRHEPMTTVGHVDHQPRSSSAAAAVRRAILEGRLAPGSRINEVQIAAELGCSRGPLREALRTLEEEGLIVKQPYRGAFVAEVSPQVIEEIASLRVRLEPFAIELALPTIRREPGGQAMKDLMEEMTAAAERGDVTSCIDVHLRFHRAIYEASGHRLLLDCWRSWESQLRVYLALDASTFTNLATLVEDHERLTGLLSEADLQAITEDVVAHVRVAAEHAADTVRHSGPPRT